MSEKIQILVVDDDRHMTRTLADILDLHGYEVTEAWSGRDALDKISLTTFDCILTDVRMPDMNGVELQKAIADVYPDLPVILMTAFATDSLLQQGMAQGVAGTLEKPLDIGILLTFFSFLRNNRTIAIVDDDPAFCQTLADILKLRGYDVIVTTNPHEQVDKMVNGAEFLLLDMKLNSINGLDVLRDIRKEHPDLPVLMITGYREEMWPAVEGALAINARACLYKPLAIPELLQTLTSLKLEKYRAILQR